MRSPGIKISQRQLIRLRTYHLETPRRRRGGRHDLCLLSGAIDRDTLRALGPLSRSEQAKRLEQSDRLADRGHDDDTYARASGGKHAAPGDAGCWRIGKRAGDAVGLGILIPRD